MKRRDFLKTSGVLLVMGSPCAGALVRSATASGESATAGEIAAVRWGLLVDLRKCPADCDACLGACRHENNVAHHDDPRWDIHWIRKVTIEPKDPARRATEEPKHVPLLCNHCDEPPCAQVCPVKATYKRRDGIVIVDHHRCIGCRYCMVACPYNARFFNYKEMHEWSNPDYPKRSHGVAESCNFCAHLVDQGKLPACVTTCRDTGAGALVFGNLNDPESEISRLIKDKPTQRIREDLGTEPKVFYIGL